MAEAVLVKTVVFDRDIYKPGHMVHRWMTLLTTHFVQHAVEAAPKRTGRMAAGVHGDTAQVGPRQVEGTIESTAPYTMFVVRGTGFPAKGREGHIYTTAGFGRREGGGFVELWGVVERGKFNRRGGMRWEREKRLVPLKGHWMALPAYGPYPGGLHFKVRGQDPNNFLLKAWRKTARTHRAIGGHIPDWLANP